MKNKIVLLAEIGAVVTITTLSASAVSLPFGDGFDYTEGERLGGTTSGVIWNVGNSTGTGSPEIRGSAALSYPGLMPLGGKGVLSSGTPGSNRDRGVLVAPDANSIANWSDLGVLYVSYLLRIDQGPSDNPRMLSAYRDSAGTGGGFTPSGAVFLGTDLRVGIAKQGGTPTDWTTIALSTSVTNLIVIKYQYVEGPDNDIMSLWINPQPSELGVPESAVPTPTLVTTTGSDDTGICHIDFTLRTAGSLNGGGTYALDEFRLGQTWADVTPLIPEPATVVLSLVGGFGLLWLRLRRRA